MSKNPFWGGSIRQGRRGPRCRGLSVSDLSCAALHRHFVGDRKNRPCSSCLSDSPFGCASYQNIGGLVIAPRFGTYYFAALVGKWAVAVRIVNGSYRIALWRLFQMGNLVLFLLAHALPWRMNNLNQMSGPSNLAILCDFGRIFHQLAPLVLARERAAGPRLAKAHMKAVLGIAITCPVSHRPSAHSSDSGFFCFQISPPEALKLLSLRRGYFCKREAHGCPKAEMLNRLMESFYGCKAGPCNVSMISMTVLSCPGGSMASRSLSLPGYDAWRARLLPLVKYEILAGKD